MRGSMPRARQSARIPGKRVSNRALSAVASSHTRCPRCCWRKISRATTSRGASSASRWRRSMNRWPRSLSSTAPSPRTASETSASGVSGVSSAVGWNCTNSMSASLHAGTKRHGVAVAGGHHGIGGIAIELSAAAGGDHGGVGHDLRGAPFDGHAHTAAFAVLHDQLQRARALQDPHAVAAVHALDERRRHLGARAVAVRVDDPVARVRPLAPQAEVATRFEIEARTGRGQLAHARRSLRDEHAHRARVAQGRAGGQRVAAVQRG